MLVHELYSTVPAFLYVLEVRGALRSVLLSLFWELPRRGKERYQVPRTVETRKRIS